MFGISVKKLKSSILAVLFGIPEDRLADEPVQWRFKAKKNYKNTYGLHITAFLKSPWYIYTEQLNHNEASLLNIEFQPNPFIAYIGKLQEIGNLIEKYDPIIKHEIRLYKVAVNFMQKVEVVFNEPTTLKGKVHYVISDGKNKLETYVQVFKITLNG